MSVDKTNVLLKQSQKIFHTSDLKVIWGIENSNTLYKSIERLAKKGVLISIQKGLYSVIPIEQLDSKELGFRIIHRQCYLSTETVLSDSGVINQSPTKITYISDISKNISVGGRDFLIRQLNSRFLNNTAGIIQKENGILVASLERAVADMLYFQPSYHFDAQDIIDWGMVKKIQSEVGYL